MWSPADKKALPTKRDAISTKKAIKELEIEFQRAVETFERVKAHMLDLKRELEECKAWIAPIQTILVEILTEILLFASKTEDLAPVK